MSRVYSDTVLPEDSGVSQDLTLGTTGDSVVVTAGASLNVNTLKDSGGNTLFVSDGSGTLSSLNAGFTGKPSLLDTNTVTGSSGSAFTTSIDNTYKLFIFKYVDVNPATNNVDFGFQCSIDGGSNYNVSETTTTWRALHNEADTTAEMNYADDDQGNGTSYQGISLGVGNGATEGCAGDLFLFNPSNTTYVKHWYGTSNAYVADDRTQVLYSSGYFNTTSAINAINFKMSSGNFDGIIQMYGL